jgi:hypothetical protein
LAVIWSIWVSVWVSVSGSGPGRHGGLRGRLVCLGLGVQRLVEDLLRLPDALDGLIDAVLALRDRRVGVLGRCASSARS